jgi:predicted HicB family RNase H-like nuclease
MPHYGMRLAWSPEDQVYVASCPELGDLSSHGASPTEAAAELSKAMELAVETFEEEGWALPEPRTVRTYSGQFRVRLPGSLHAWLAETAEAEGVSLNTFVVAKLSEARGVIGPAKSGFGLHPPSLRASARVRAADRG